MKIRITENETLKKAFRNAHLARQTEEGEKDRQARNMRRVRQIGPLQAGRRFWPAFEHVVWRLAPVNCLLIVLLIILFLKIGLYPGSDVLAALTVEAEEPTLSQVLGIGG